MKTIPSLSDFVIGEEVRVLDSYNLYFGIVQQTKSKKKLKILVRCGNGYTVSRDISQVAKLDEMVCVVRNFVGNNARTGKLHIDREKYPQFFSLAKSIPMQLSVMENDGVLYSNPNDYFLMLGNINKNHANLNNSLKKAGID